MLADIKLKPVFLARDGVNLAHFETGPGNPQSPPLVLINGWTGDHGIFTPQIIHFGESRRVVAINLRGHGASDAPKQEYTMAGFADDIAWQCAELGLHRPVVIGHSLGGAISLELCGRYPELASGLVMIDSIASHPERARPLNSQEQNLSVNTLLIQMALELSKMAGYSDHGAWVTARCLLSRRNFGPAGAYCNVLAATRHAFFVLH